MINATQAAELAGRSKTVPEKIQKKLEGEIKRAAKQGLNSAEAVFYDMDVEMANRIVDFLTGLGYGVRQNFVRDQRDGSMTHVFKIVWARAGGA